MPSLHTTLVDRDGLCGLVGPRSAAVQCIGKGAAGGCTDCCLDGLQQRCGAGCQTRTGMNKFHPRGVAVQGASSRLLIGEPGEPTQVTPVGAGGITYKCTPTTCRQRSPPPVPAGADWRANPGLQMARTGLHHHTRIMPVGAHVRDHARPRNIQIDENVACVLLSTVGLNIHIATFQVASAQKPNRGRVGQLGGGPQPFARKGAMSLVGNPTDEVQLMRHCHSRLRILAK